MTEWMREQKKSCNTAAKRFLTWSYLYIKRKYLNSNKELYPEFILCTKKN